MPPPFGGFEAEQFGMQQESRIVLQQTRKGMQEVLKMGRPGAKFSLFAWKQKIAKSSLQWLSSVSRMVLARIVMDRGFSRNFRIPKDCAWAPVIRSEKPEQRITGISALIFIIS